MPRDPRISMPVGVAKELMDAYDSWEGNIPWDLDEGRMREEYVERHERLRARIERLNAKRGE